MSNALAEVSASGCATTDSWFLRAVARRQAEESGVLEIQGARFNSSI